MLKTILDYSILNDFVNTQPKQIPIGSVDDNETWLSFWKYLKEGTDLTLIINEEINNIFITQLTTGRRGSIFKIQEKFNKPHKQILPKNTNKQTAFYISEQNETIKENYRKKNGLIFGFLNDYKNIWQEMSLYNKPKVLSVSKSELNSFKSWSELSKYLLPFTDLIIVDNYIFDENIWDANLFEIIRQFNKIANVKFNLLIISYIGNNNEHKINDIYNKVQAFIKDENILCELGITLSTRGLKKHDRAIYSNYLRINSGDSFNYFDSKNRIITKGTEISFYPLCENDKYFTTQNSLDKISELIAELKIKDDADKYIKGNINNNLLRTI